MKVVNVVLGIATAIILGALINLGIRAFYPEPAAPTYQNYPIVTPCATNDISCQTKQAALSNQQQATANQQEQSYQDQMGVYNKNLFIIANVIGIVMFALGFWLVFGVALASNAVPVGIMLAGLWSIMYGYARGWGSVNDPLKFFVGLVIAVLVIGGSMWLIQRYQKGHTTRA
jgi:heme/copper-type cytochrome/quinol oxidase subunit 4